MTRGQVKVLDVLRGPCPWGHGLWNAREIAAVLEREDPGIRVMNWTYDRVHSILVRLERRGYVLRLHNRASADDWKAI